MNGLSTSIFLLGSLLIVMISGENIQFTEDDYSAVVNETTIDTPLPTSSIVTVRCMHTINNSTSNITYQLVGNDTTFTLNNETGGLMVAMDLDYETVTSYQVLAKCYSTLNRSWSDEVPINISVLPINEYRPIVSTTTESQVLTESTPLGTVIISTLPGGRIIYSASDEDAGPDGNIYYSIVSTTDNETFAFNSTIGALYVAKSFDLDAVRVAIRRENVQITACDSSPPTPDCLNIDVTIILITSNDNTPRFIRSSVNVSYPEDVDLATTITQVECSDDDYLTGELAGYEIMSVSPTQTPMNTFRITSTGTIRLDLPLDFELTNVYELRVRCFDTGSPVMDDFATVRVNVSAANDNAPKFTNSSVNVTHRETVDPLTLIVQVICSDDDLLVGELSGYEIVSVTPALTPAGTFSINSTGAIETQLPLDFEFTQSYELQVRCFDTGSPILEDFANVTVTLEPVNDNAPRFLDSSVNVSHSESVNVTTVIAQLQCSDEDISTGAFAGYEFTSVSPPETPHGTFSISKEGMILLNLPLDFEFTDTYELEVRCFDSGPLVMDDLATVRVSVYDINDNSPVCAPVPDQSLPAGTYSHEVIVSLNCTDADSDKNGQLSYSFSQVPALASGDLTVNPATGQVTLLGAVSESGNHTIQILISDMGTPSLSTDIAFQISIRGMVLPPTPLSVLPLWAILVIVVVGLLLICCVLIFAMCCRYCCCTDRRSKKDLSRRATGVENDYGVVYAQYSLDSVSDRESPELESDIEDSKNYKDYILHFKTTSFDNTSAVPTTPTSFSTEDDEENEGVVYTTSTEFILNPPAVEEELFPPDEDQSPRDGTPNPPDSNNSPPEVMLTVETSDVGLRTPGMDHSRDLLISSEGDDGDEDEEVTGV